MKKRLKFWLFVMIILATTFTLKNNLSFVNADTTTVKDFYFSDTSGKNLSEGGVIDMTTAEKSIYVTTEKGMLGTDIVEWTSSNEEIAAVESTGSNTATIKRKGPGYARITCRITRGNVYFSISILAYTEIEVKVEKDSISDKFTPLVPVRNNDEKGIVLDYCPDASYVFPGGSQFPSSQEIILQYTVNPEIVKNELLTWKSNEDTVAKVTKSGVVNATGAGYTTVDVKTNTMDGKHPDSETIRVFVNPLVNTNIWGASGADEWVSQATITGSSDFYIQTNALRATNLDWQVTDLAGNALPQDSEQIQWTPSGNSGSFHIQNAKVGVYKVKAFIPGLNENSLNVKYLDLTVVIPFSAPDSITMNVTDTYNLLENLNMGEKFVSIKSSNNNIVGVNSVTGVLTAKATGTAEITLMYRQYEGGKLVEKECKIQVKVIDALALNLSDATIYVGGTVKLEATVTDVTAQLKWSSSNDAIATVEDGEVVGVSAGECKITVTTKINGVVKTASCNIMVVAAVTNIKIDPAEVSFNIGEYKTLTATIAPESLNTMELKWISSNEKVVRIAETGKKYATIQAVGGGTAVITAINKNNVVVGFCDVTVKQPVTSITLSDTNVTISLSKSNFQLRATVLPKNATDQDVKYSSTNTSVARVDDTGKVTLVSAGTTSIIVTSVDSPSISAICNVTVTMPVSGITIDNTTLDMLVGETRKITYTLAPANATNKNVTFKSSDPSVCSVTNTGNVNAIKSGTAIISVTTEDGLFSKSCTVTVRQFATGITLDVSDLTLNVKERYTLKPVTTPANTTDQFTYSSSNTKVATVNASGKITGVSAGTAIVIVSTANGKTAFCNVTVKQQATGIKLNYSKKTVVVTNSFTLKATVLPENATNQGVTYSSSNTKVATVSSKGKVTGKKGGTAIITVKSKDGGFTELCVVTVKELVTSISVKSSYYVKKGNTYTIVPKVKTNSATNTKLKWSSSNTKVLTVDQKGKVKAKAYGKATITIRATDGSGAKATCTVRVIRPVTSVSLNYNVLTMVEGSKKTLKAKVNPSNASVKGLKWSSSDESIAMVNSKGKIVAISEGKVTITATSTDGTKKKAKCIVNVIKKVGATSITVADQSVVMITGESRTVQTVMSPANTTDGAKWSSDNTAVATVNQKTGRIVAKAIGTATITVMTDSGKTAKITIQVVGLNKTSLTLEQYSTYTLWVDGNKSNAKWDVQNPAVATVENGLVTARATGTTNIIATVNGRRLYCKLKVVKIK